MLEPGLLDPRIEPVEAWRLERLLVNGYSVLEAEKIATRLDVDLHQAVSLVRAGCPPDIAVNILL